MARISKPPEERRRELVDAAERLFLTRGYEATTVADIVREVDVAQGTYYYHFASKADILEAIAERMTAAVLDDVARSATDPARDAPARLCDALHRLLAAHETRQGLVAVVHEERNLALHHRLGRRMLERLVPLLAGVIADGCRAGVFHTPYPTEAAECLLACVGYFSHLPDTGRADRIRGALDHLLVGLLGLREPLPIHATSEPGAHLP